MKNIIISLLLTYIFTIKVGFISGASVLMGALVIFALTYILVGEIEYIWE